MVRDPALFIWCIVAAVAGVAVFTAALFNWRNLRHLPVFIATAACVAVMVFLLVTAVRW